MTLQIECSFSMKFCMCIKDIKNIYSLQAGYIYISEASLSSLSPLYFHFNKEKVERVMKWSRERDKQKEERESFGNFTDFVYDMEIVVLAKSYTMYIYNRNEKYTKCAILVESYTYTMYLSLSTIIYFSILVQQIYAL